MKLLIRWVSKHSKILCHGCCEADIEPCSVTKVLDPNHSTKGKEWNVSQDFQEESRREE